MYKIYLLAVSSVKCFRQWFTYFDVISKVHFFLIYILTATTTNITKLISLTKSRFFLIIRTLWCSILAFVSMLSFLLILSRISCTHNAYYRSLKILMAQNILAPCSLICCCPFSSSNFYSRHNIVGDFG